METAVRDTVNSVAARVGMVVAGCADAPWQYDYFAIMRRLEATAMSTPRWGTALLPSAEPIRVGQEPSMIFAPAGVSRFDKATANSPPRLRQRFFGYIGPNGPLPTHLSEFIQERALNHADPTWLAFLDGFTHRFALHFYRAWAQARPAVSLDRPHQDKFRDQIGALVGIGTAQRQKRDAVHDDARLHFSGMLVRQIRSAESLQSVIQTYFGVPARLQPWAGRWMRLPTAETTRLGRAGVAGSLGLGAVLGKSVWDRQHQVRLVLGPLSLAEYRRFLPNGTAPSELRVWMRQLLGDEFDWDAKLELTKEQVPQTKLGRANGNSPLLGWTSWLGQQRRQHNASDVCLRSH